VVRISPEFQRLNEERIKELVLQMQKVARDSQAGRPTHVSGSRG